MFDYQTVEKLGSPIPIEIDLIKWLNSMVEQNQLAQFVSLAG